MTPSFPDEAFEFHQTADLEQNVLLVKENRDLDRQFQKLQLMNLTFRILARNIISLFFLIILILQYGVIFFLMYKSFKYGSLIKLQTFFGSLFTFTVIETYAILKVIVNWLFKDEKFEPDHKPSS